jgi:spore maturation protein CgeB
MSPMKILYVGSSGPGGTSKHRADALARVGNQVVVLDPKVALECSRLLFGNEHFHRFTGQWFRARKVAKWLYKNRMIGAANPDLVWVNSGETLSRKSLQLLKQFGAPIVLYNNDDPLGVRDGRRFQQVKHCIDLYDVCVTMRRPTVEDMSKSGAKRVLQVSFSYDEVEHRPVDACEKIPNEFCADVCFVGTWMRGERRDEFLNKLWRAGLRVSIWGPRWEKSPFKELVKSCWKGSWISGRQYVYALAGAKVCLGMLSKGNRDEHTTRSVEIPYAGGLLCAERTSEHMRMFKEGEEAAFWSSPEECIQVCRDLLANEDRRQAIVANGMRKVSELKVGNENIARRILHEVFVEQQ